MPRTLKLVLFALASVALAAVADCGARSTQPKPTCTRAPTGVKVTCR